MRYKPREGHPATSSLANAPLAFPGLGARQRSNSPSTTRAAVTIDRTVEKPAAAGKAARGREHGKSRQSPAFGRERHCQDMRGNVHDDEHRNDERKRNPQRRSEGAGINLRG